MNREDAKSAKKRMKQVENKDIGRIVVDSAVRVHGVLGHGLHESEYKTCLIMSFDMQVRRANTKYNNRCDTYPGFAALASWRFDSLHRTIFP